jgi:hypothetical protein
MYGIRVAWESDLEWACKNWPIARGRSLPALRLVPGEKPGSWVLLPGLHEVDRCLSCDEWVPIWRWALHAREPGDHRVHDRGALAQRRAQATADASRMERRIHEEEAKIARYAVHGPSQNELDMLRRWRALLEVYRHRAAGDFSDQRDTVLRFADTVYEPDRRHNYTLHSIEEAAQLLGMPVERLHAAVAAGRVRTAPDGLDGPPYVPSFELERLRELVEHAAWRRRHRDDPIQRWLRGRVSASEGI